jgi:DNA-binding CsgD family transcriptional regulator
VARRLIERLRALPEGGLGVRPVRSPLTSREWEVLDLLCAGLTVDGVADRLVLSRATVRTHVKRILRKLGVRSQRDAIEMANSIRATYAPGTEPPRRSVLRVRRTFARRWPVGRAWSRQGGSTMNINAQPGAGATTRGAARTRC